MSATIPQTEPSEFMSDTARRIAEQWTESQRQSAEFMTSFTEMWKDFMEEGGSPQSWQEKLSSWSEKASESSRTTFQAFENMGEQFMQGFGRVFSSFGTLDDDSPGWLRGFMAPSFGLFREQQTTAKRALEAWMRGQKHQLEYQHLISGALTKVWLALGQEVQARWSTGKPFGSSREFFETWVSVADKVFTALFASEEYGKAQSQMLNAQHEAKQQVQQMKESWLSSQGLPTKSDLDAAHKAIYDLRKKVRRLERELEAVKS